MNKTAETDYPVHELIRNRWSPRAFSSEPIEPSTIRSLFEAARWAPSSFNEQPWRFLIATREEPDDFDEMLKHLSDGNQEWATRAPLLVLTFAKLHFDRNGRVNRHAWHDVGQAVAYLSLQAMSVGLFVHQMAGIRQEMIEETYDVPAGFAPVTALAIGWLAEPEVLPERLAERERGPRSGRGSQDTFVFGSNWDIAADI